MVQIIPQNKRNGFAEHFGQELSRSIDAERQLQKAMQVEQLKQAGKEKLLGQKNQLLQQIFSGRKQPSFTEQISQEQPQGQITQEPPQEIGQQFDPSKISDEDILQLTALDPAMGREARAAKDTVLREQREKEKTERSEFEAERSYHTGFSKEAEKEVEQMRSVIPKKEMALNFARNAIETGDLGYFSPDKLADATGIDLFRTAKGAQLLTAGKENLLNNMGRVSAKAQNIWFEQRLNSMFPKIGQSKEANLTTQEMLEGELELDKAYQNEFDRLAQQDDEKYGFVRKDISKRARDAIKPIEKDILNRTTYRMKEIEEQEKGLSSLKSQVGKNVVKGTPLTLAMAKLYKDKFGDNALDVARKNGYTIPTIEEFKTYQSRPAEYREQR